MGFFGRLIPKRQTGVEGAFIRAIKASEPSRGADSRIGFQELCTLLTQSAALGFLQVKKDKAFTNPLDHSSPLAGVEGDVALFEAAAWFLASVRRFVRRSPEVPDEMRPLLAERYAQAQSDIGSVFEVEGGFPGGRSLLNRRIETYPPDVQEAIGFFWAALMEGRGRRSPTPEVQGGPPPPNFTDGLMLPMLATGYCTEILKPRLEALMDFVKRASAAADSAFPDSEESAGTPMEAFAAAITDAKISDAAKDGTSNGYLSASVFLTLSFSQALLKGLRRSPGLHDVLSANHPDVVLHELSALLLGRAEKTLEERRTGDKCFDDDDFGLDDIDEGDDGSDDSTTELISDRLTEIAVVLGGVFEKVAGFQNGQKILLSRTVLYQMRDSGDANPLARALVADAGHSTPQPVGYMRRGDPGEQVALGEAIDAVLAAEKALPAFFSRAREYAEKLAELAKQQGEGEDDEGT